MDDNERIMEYRRATWRDNARAHAIKDAEEAELRGPEREAFILERMKIYYAELEKIAGM
jgi:hypothetical protein